MQKNHYEILGLLPSATERDIKAAYRAKMREYHPDYFAGQKRLAEQLGDQQQMFELNIALQQAEEMTKQVNAAYRVLSDPVKRRQYDARLSRRELEVTHYPPSQTARAPTPAAKPVTEEMEYWSKVVNFYFSPWLLLLVILILLCGGLFRAMGT